MLNKRTQILLKNETWERLKNISESRGVSIGTLIRNAIEDIYINTQKDESIANAVDSIKNVRKIHKGINYKDLINYGRKY
ncbi:hypothetical protein COV24_02615 [candidate division WWE3 bacterium CG10_big_fil_rev_8_21_14_0_10_32_10]|uniref:Ribbon-helix-helix protein CopG domain-containing protein n=1 Tax=candidate division WWE3 bacterium CG10_big_fil_rev_8_21_14_0_10_32_10 TaxID=1975090 RepID=A0A2H0RAB4_UNCKA|nr:MAG: hypothetical protein COV24_02615 [candidate division WWE3 bacterium CG10_big_fil_rev_8_21_14_0_10_32_10]